MCGARTFLDMRAAVSPRVAASPAAYCAHSNTIFTYEERDLFAGELFCPCCSARTDPAHRASSLEDLRRLFPAAVLYTALSPVEHLQTRD